MWRVPSCRTGTPSGTLSAGTGGRSASLAFRLPKGEQALTASGKFYFASLLFWHPWKVSKNDFRICIIVKKYVKKMCFLYLGGVAPKLPFNTKDVCMFNAKRIPIVNLLWQTLIHWSELPWFGKLSLGYFVFKFADWLVNCCHPSLLDQNSCGRRRSLVWHSWQVWGVSEGALVPSAVAKCRLRPQMASLLLHILWY